MQCDAAQCGAIALVTLRHTTLQMILCSVMLLNVGYCLSHIETHHTADDPVQCDAAQCGAIALVTLRRITLQMILCSVMLLNVGLLP